MKFTFLSAVKAFVFFAAFAMFFMAQSVNAQTISTFPHLVTFSETGWTAGSSAAITPANGDGWGTTTTSNPKWERENAASGSNQSSTNTGPLYDNTTPGVNGGRWVFLECSGGSLGSTSYLESPTLAFGTAPLVKLEFYYHMYGSTMGTLEVEQYVGTTWVTTGWSMTGQQHSTPAALFTKADITLNPLATKIRFKGVRGSSYYSDMAIDDVKFYIPVANDLAMLSWDAPLSGTTPSATMPITVSFINAGTTTQDSMNLKYSIDGGVTIITEMYTDSVQPGDTGTYTFTATANMSAVGYYYCGAVVQNAGDIQTYNDTVFAQPYLCQSLSGVYTLGTDSLDDYNSFADLAFALANCGVSGPVTINVDAGTYTEQVTFGAVAGASAINTITIQSATGVNTDVTLTANSSAQYSSTLHLSGASYYTFKDMTFTHSSTYGTYNYCRAIFLDNGSMYNKFKGNKIQMSTALNQSDRGIEVNGATCSMNRIDSNIITGGYYSVYLYGGSSSSRALGNEVVENTMTGWQYYGAYIYYQDSFKVVGNLIENRTSGSSTVYGLYTYYVFNGFVIANNNFKIHAGTSTAYAMRVYYANYYSYASGTEAPAYVYNNFMSITGTNNSSGHYGLYAYNSDKIEYYYNSVNVNCGSTTSNAMYQYNSASNTTGQKFVNNVFANTAGGRAAYIGSLAVVDTLDYNVYYTTGANIGYVGGNMTDFAAFQTATGMDVNSFSTNPGFVSNTDLHVNNAMVDGAAMPISMITHDIDGDVRSLTTPDIGADEFVVITDDAGVIALNGITGICPGSSAAVMAEVKNFGVDTLFSATINWSVNGVAQAAYPFTDTLAPLATKMYSLGTYPMAANMSYDFIASTTMPNGVADMKTDNDTIWENNIQPSMPGGTYTIGADSTDDFPSFNAAVAAMNLNGICGAIVFDVDAGIYTERVEIEEILGASMVNTIIFKSATGLNTDVELTYTSSTTYDQTVLLRQADYITFKDMTISHTSLYGNYNYCNAVKMRGHADHNTITGCILKLPIPTGYSQDRVIEIREGGNSDFNTISNNTIIGGYYSAYIYGGGATSRSKGNKLLNNDCSGFYYYGLYLSYQDTMEVMGNTIHTPSPSANGLYGMYVNYWNDGSVIANNTIKLANKNATVYGMQVRYGNYYYYNSTPQSPNLMYNNMISIYEGNAGYNGTNYGVYDYYNGNTNFYYNSVSVTKGSTTARAWYQTHTSSTANTDTSNYLNNMFYCNTGGYAAYFATPATVGTNNYNVYWADTAVNNFVYWSGNKTDLAALQAANGKDVNSIEANPGFISTSNLHKSPSSPNDLGTPIAGITTDIDGDTRKAATPDQGADEWDQPANDVLVSEVLNPMSSLCGSATAPVEVVVYNLGTNAQTSIPVGVIGNGPNGSITLNAVVPSLASGAIDTITVGTISTLLPGNYEFKAYTALIGDAEVNNDTLPHSFNIVAPLANPFFEDFETSMYTWNLSGTYIGNSSGLPGSYLYKNLYSTSTTGNAYLEGKIATVPANSYLTFDYRVVDYSGGAATVLQSDTFQIMMSNDCNNTWNVVYTIDSNNHVTSQGMATVMVPLTAFVGNEVGFGIELYYGDTSDNNDYYFDIDNIGISTPPMVDLGPDTTFCDGLTITLDAGMDSAYMFTYMWNDVATGDTLGMNQTLDVMTARTIVVKVSNEQGITTNDTIMTSLHAATAVSFTGLMPTYCTNDMASTLTGTPATGIFTGNGISGSSFDPAMAGNGNHMVTYTYTNPANMCMDYAMDSTMVYDAPVATMTMDTTICEGETVMLSAGTPVAAPGLIFSQYIEGSSNNKAIEIFNASMDTLDLDNYRIAQASNGNGWAYWHTFPAGTKLAPNATWVMVTNQVSDTYYDTANADEVLGYPSLCHGNGDDARAIEVTYDGGTTWMIIDIFGDPDNDPGSAWDVAGVNNATANHTLVRKSTIMGGNTNWIAAAGTDSMDSEYMVYPQNTFTGLGSHMVIATVAPSYLWSTGDTTAMITVMPTMTMNYTVVVDNGNCQTTDSVMVTVNPLPVVNLGPDTTFKWTWESITLDAGNPNATWTWSTGDMTQTVVLDSNNMMLGANTVSVEVVENGCTAVDTVEVTVVDDVSINEANANIAIEVYPNPTKGQFNMTINGVQGNLEMVILDIAGQVVYSERINVTTNYVGKFDMRTLAKGVYYIKLSSDNTSNVQKLIIQ